MASVAKMESKQCLVKDIKFKIGVSEEVYQVSEKSAQKCVDVFLWLCILFPAKVCFKLPLKIQGRRLLG